MSEPKRDELLDHDYDGIREFDNRLPNWWLYTLYGAIVFGVFYWLAFHTWELAPLSLQEYDREMVAAAEVQLERMRGQKLNDDALALMSTIPANVERGKGVFEQFCVTCHLADGSGSVGPNLTDRYWLHGSKPMQIHETVTNGVVDKGMAAWGNQLGPMRVQDVVAYVLTLKGKNRPGKEPQGVEESETEAGEPEPSPDEQATSETPTEESTST